MTSPRRFDALRARPAAPVSTGEQEPIESVIRRLFVTSADGHRVLAWMLEETGRTTALNAPEAVLRDAEGARRLVEKIRGIIGGDAA
jgi:hypothetical protein